METTKRIPENPENNTELDTIMARFEKQISSLRTDLEQLRLKRNQHEMDKPVKETLPEQDAENKQKALDLENQFERKNIVWNMTAEDIKADIRKTENSIDLWEKKFLECYLFKKENISPMSQSPTQPKPTAAALPTSTARSKPKLKLHKGISTVPTYTLAYSKTTPFQTWYKTMFKPEIKPLCENNDEFVLNLKYYIHTECWSMVHPLMDEAKLGDRRTICDTMDSVFKETKTRTQLHQEFTDYKQTVCDVQRYSAHKLKLFKKANPTLDCESNNFKASWLNGLAPPLALEVARIKPSYLEVEWTECLNVCIDEENAQKKLNINYEVHSRTNTHQSTQSPSNSSKDKKKGKRGQRKSQTPATPGGQSSAGAISSQPAKPATTNPNVRKYAGICHATQKCREDQVKHPYFACRNSTCKSCKTLGHTHLQCPRSKCITCSKSGHDTKVHGLDRKTPVF